MASHVKENVRNFCEVTTFHGFRELWTSRTIFLKIFWIVVLSAGCFLTCYQVHGVIVNFQKNPTKTLIVRLRDHPPKYPPVQICYHHWIYWVNWTKILEINLDSKTLLFAMSMLIPSYSSKQFNVSEVAKNFNDVLLPSLNLSNVMDFYLFISNDIPYNVMQRNSKMFKREFNEKWYTEFCYTITATPEIEGTVLRLTFAAKNLGGTTDVDKFISKFNFSQEFTYAARWAYFYSSDGVDPGPNINSTVIAPFFIYPVNNDEDFVTIDTSSYYHYDVCLTGTVYRWQNSVRRPCFESESSFRKSSPICMRNCFSSYKFSSPYCGLTFVNNVVYDAYYSIYSRLPHMSYDHCLSMFSYRESFNYSNATDSDEKIVYTNNSYFMTLYDQCRNSCKPVCEQWSFEKTVASFVQPAIRNPYCYVIIKYPPQENILVVNELDAYSWEDIIANVGGLLGLWMGASVVSLFQIVHVCVCSPVEKRLRRNLTKKKTTSFHDRIPDVNGQSISDSRDVSFNQYHYRYHDANFEQKHFLHKYVSNCT